MFGPFMSRPYLKEALIQVAFCMGKGKFTSFNHGQMLFNPKHYRSLLHLFQFSPCIQYYAVVLFKITCEHVFGVISWTETFKFKELLTNALSSSTTLLQHITFASAHHKRTCRLWKIATNKITSKISLRPKKVI